MLQKNQKQELIQFVDNLSLAHEEILNAIKNGNVLSAQKMIQECQEYSIHLGCILEKMVQENAITVSYIEQYCESLFYIYSALDKTEYNQYKIRKILSSKLTKIENSIKNDLAVKKEIVFFPYKASMWDSLESIYFKMKEDPKYDVRCVPIPYYNLNPDGSLGNMYYEGSEYPETVEVTDWQTYCFEEIKPDMIFIHNPYDNMNYVTSVHPRFYAQNLKQYTDELIYIPYFILKEISPDDQAAIDSIKHFCFLPGVIYADKVIVQSENIRQIYINEFIKFAKLNNFSGKYIDRRYLEQKIVGTGSPKIEKIKCTRREELQIPDEWLRIIMKPDGTRKKIILYNISITTLLQDSDAMIMKKIPCVLADFKRRKDDIALIWRPHPLLINTIESIRPYLYDMYREIVNEYLIEGWGIYDDSADVDRAVALSDIYCGSESSVVRLYEILHKPVLLQEQFLEAIKSMCVITDNIYCLNTMGNCINFVKRTEDGLIVRWFYKLCDQRYAYEKIFRFGNKIIFIPREADEVVIFDPKEIVIDTISVPKNDKFITYYLLDHILYLFPCMGQDIVEIDLQNKNSFCYKLPDDLVKGDDNSVFSYDIVKIQDGFFTVVPGTNQIFEFNILTKQSKIYRLSDDYLINCICGDAYKIWLLTNYNTIAEWCYETNQIEELCKCGANNDDFFGMTLFIEETGEIWISLLQRSTILICKCQGEQKREINLFSLGRFIWMMEKNEQNVWVSLEGADCIVSINIYTKEIDKLQIF